MPTEVVYAGFSMADSSLADYDEQAAMQLEERVLDFLKRAD